MNSAQKKGLGSLIALLLAGVAAACELAGVQVPGWLPMVSQIVAIAAGAFGIAVNLPSNTR